MRLFSTCAESLRSTRFVLILCMLLVLGSVAFAQEATIVGTISDPTGAAVPNVSVTIKSVETGQASKFVTNEVGQYVAPSLRIGHYNVVVEASGFKKMEQKDLVLNVGDRARLDFKLEIGSSEQQVTVEANAIAVQSDTSEISGVIDGKQVTQLATNGRSIYTLINLVPGAASLQGDFQVPTPTGGDFAVSFNGSRPGHNIYLLDGGENLDRGGAGTFSVMPSLDAIAEFRTLTSNYSAEYGLSSAATMTTILKSGGSKYHASAWEFVRNDAFDSMRFFQKWTNADPKKPKLRYNTYGFNIGGPVDFLKSEHKTFFFYNMEWRKLIQGGQITGRTVPMPATYGGVFTGNVPGDGKTHNGTVIANSGFHVPCANQLSTGTNGQYEAFQAAGITTFSTPRPDGSCAIDTREGMDAAENQPVFAAWPSNTIPAALLNGNAQTMLSAGIFPAPTSGNQFTGGNDAPTFVREEIVRMDHNFSSKFSIFGHWVSEQISQGYGTTMWSGDNVPTIGNSYGNPSYSAVVHAINTINPTLINEASFNYNGNRINIIPNGLVSVPGFEFNRVFSGPNEMSRAPIIALNGSTGAQYSANWTPWRNKADSYQLKDDISWVKGAHQLKFGGSWQLYKKIQDVFATTEGNFSFNGYFTGNDFADYLLGYSNQYSENAVKDKGHWNAVSWALYVQDNWRVNNRLTLNLGLRWDGAPHTYEANNRMSNFYPNLYNAANGATFAENEDGSLNTNVISPTSLGLGGSPQALLAGYQFYVNGLGIDGKNGIPKGMVDNHWATFGPRVGFAYDVTGRGNTVVRGGFGVMYERIQGNDVYGTGTNVPFSAQATLNNVSLQNPRLNVVNGSVFDPATQLPIVVSDITGFDRKEYKMPVSYQYSIGIQQSLGPKSVFSASFVGNELRHQSDYEQINLVDPSLLAELTDNNSTITRAGETINYNQLVPYTGYKSIRLARDEANGDYKGLQLDLKSTVKNDLQLQFGYTVSRSEDPVAGNSNGFDLNNTRNPYEGWRYDYGPSFFDRKHVAYVNFIYDLPIFRHSESRLLKSTLGGWQLSGIVSMMSGAPLDVTLGTGNSVSNVVPQTGNRPNLTGPISYTNKNVYRCNTAGDTCNWYREWFTGQFAVPDSGTWGNMGHNSVRGPGRQNWNMAIMKSFAIDPDRGSKVEFRAEAFNLWNHTQYRGDFQGGGVSINWDNNAASNFGCTTATYDARIMQFGLKVIF